MIKKPKILAVDDELSMREFLELMLTKEGYDVSLASDGNKALDLIKKDSFDLVITDIRMQEVDGIEVLRHVKKVNPETVVILISAFATVETAVVAMREGAFDFVPKPFNIDDLKKVIQHALAHRTPEEEQAILKETVQKGCHFGSLVGVSAPMKKIYDLVRRAAQTSTNILITGESGTGKELVAKAVHENSPRRDNRFVAINCGGMPEQLIESELFGHKKGSFTGATSDKRGLFEVADSGTIFLDELAELSLPMQVKLLRVVQDKVFRPVGGTRESLLDVRFIAATNKNLENEVMAGRFREDLYYRLNVINIHMPPLRERKDDIGLLAQFFLDKYNTEMNKSVRKLSGYALDILTNYHFPGNVRELENIIERSVALEQTNIVLPESLTLASFKQERRMGSAPREMLPKRKTDESQSDDPPLYIQNILDLPAEGLDEALAVMERGLLIKAMCAADGNRQKAAKLLSTNTRSLRYRLAKHDLQGLSRNQFEQKRVQCDTDADPTSPLNPSWPPAGLDLDTVIADVEKQFVESALAKAEGSKTKAAELLGISFRSFRYRLSKFDDLA